MAHYLNYETPWNRYVLWQSFKYLIVRATGHLSPAVEVTSYPEILLLGGL